MVLHANHQYRIGPQGSAYSTVTSTTAASTLRTASIRQERSCTKLAKPKHKPEPPTAQCHFRYGRAAKQVYEKGGEEITQIEWETLNASLRKTLRMLEHRDAERQALATARLATEFKDFTPKIPCPEYASDYQALLAISRASDPRMWRKGMNDGWVDLEKQAPEMMKRLQSGQWTLRDMREQFQAVLKMGPLGNIMNQFPGMSGLDFHDSGQRIKKWMTMMDSMTESELVGIVRNLTRSGTGWHCSSDGLFVWEPTGDAIFVATTPLSEESDDDDFIADVLSVCWKHGVDAADLCSQGYCFGDFANLTANETMCTGKHDYSTSAMMNHSSLASASGQLWLDEEANAQARRRRWTQARVGTKRTARRIRRRREKTTRM